MGTWMRILLACYFPFIALICIGLLAAILAMYIIGANNSDLWWLYIPATLLFVPLGQFLYPIWRALRHKVKKDRMELKLPKEQLRGLYEFVEKIADKCDLPMPKEIRLGADSAAHVYDDKKGRRILVVGGLSVSAFSQHVLGGIIGHELAHFEAGDTALLRRAANRHLLMLYMEFYFRYVYASQSNPLVWILYAYHFLYELAFASVSRQQEFAADARSAEVLGPEGVATALFYLTVTDFLPTQDMGDLIETFVATNQPMTGIFAERVRLIDRVPESTWKDAFKRAMSRTTAALDSHPCLASRLARLDVSPKKALEYSLNQVGPSARKLVPGWDKIEKELSDRLIEPYREYFLMKLDIGALIKAM